MLHIIMCSNQMFAQAHALLITIRYYALGLIIIIYHSITANPLYIYISSISLSFVLSTNILSDLRFSQQWLGRLLVIWNPMICSLLERYTTLEECTASIFRVHFWPDDGGNRSLTVAHTYQTASYYIPEESNVQNTIYFNMASRQNN
jgi:hypothetical protein